MGAVVKKIPDWVPNEADKLLEQVAEMRRRCSHGFTIVEMPRLEESNVPGVYVAYEASSQRGDSYNKITLRCLRCSLEKKVSAMAMCPHCMSDMKDLGGLERREKYFGEDFLYYRAQVRRCGNQICGFTIVLDVWDQ